MAMLAFAHGASGSSTSPTAIMGAGFGLAFSAMSSLIVSAVPPAQTGVASGMNANIRTIGGSIGAALMASIVTSNIGPTGFPAESGYTLGFADAGRRAADRILCGSADSGDPRRRSPRAERTGSTDSARDDFPHAELAMVPGGTIVGDESE